MTVDYAPLPGIFDNSGAAASAQAASQQRFKYHNGTVTASGGYSMSSWDSAHYDASAGSINQALPASGAASIGDEVELYLDAVSGTNTLTGAFNGSTVMTLKVAGHKMPMRYNGTTWLRTEEKTLASQDNRYLTELNVKDSQFGAKGNAVRLSASAITASSNSFSDGAANFTGADVGKTIAVPGAGAAGATLVTTFASFVDSHHMNLTVAASTTVSSQSAIYGTDDTVALQALVTYCIINNRRGFLPAGNFLITSPINFSYRPLWGLSGEHWGATTVTQATDNVAIFNLGSDTVSLMHTYSIENMNFDYGAFQPSTNTGAVPMLFSQMCFQGLFRSLKFSNGCYAQKVASGILPPWGTTWDDIQFNSGLSGGAMDWSVAGTTGTPNNHFGRMVMSCGNMVGPVFDIRGYNFTIDELEFLSAAQGPKLLHLQAGAEVVIGAMKLEIGAYASGQGGYLFQADVNAYVDVGTISIGGTTMTVNNISPAVCSAQSGARFRVGYMTINCTSATSGTLYAASAASAPGIEIDTLVIGTNCALANNGGSQSPEYVRVKQWQNDHMSQDKGDANYTVALGDPNVIAFRTAFTAQRTLTLPSDGNNLHNGLYYEVVLDGAINGANTLVVQSSSNVLATITTDKTIVRFTYSRLDASHGYNGWKITKYELRADSGSLAVTPNVQVFTSNGTWTKPSGVTTVRVYAIGPGGGGGSGRRGAAASVRCGGGGGSSGAKTYGEFQAADLTSTVSVTVGTGGAGGTAVAVDDTNGNAGGTPATTTKFGSYLQAGNGTGGAGGTNAAGAGGSVSGGTFNGIAGGSASTTGAVGGNASSGGSVASGGGAGGGITSADATSNGGSASPPSEIPGAGPTSGGTTPGGTGATGISRTTNEPLGGYGGGGGASSITGAAGAGGGGGNYGAGAGGGGASLNGNNSGAGGAGANGIVIVISQ